MDSIKKRDGILLRHSHAAVRSGITGQISSVHSVAADESHKVMHRRRDKFSAARDLHVGVRVRHDSVPARINNLSVHARVMITLLFQDGKRTCLSQMAVTAT